MQESKNALLSESLLIIIIIVKQAPLPSRPTSTCRRRRLLNPAVVPLRRDRVPIRVDLLSSLPSLCLRSRSRTERSLFLLVLLLRFGREVVIPGAGVPSRRGFIIIDFTRAAEQSRSRHQALALRRRGRLLTLRLFRHEGCRSAAAGGHCIATEEIARVVARATFERGGGGSCRRARAGRRSGDECRNRRRRRRHRGGRRRAKVGVPRRVGDRRSPIA